MAPSTSFSGNTMSSTTSPPSASAISFPSNLQSAHPMPHSSHNSMPSSPDAVTTARPLNVVVTGGSSGIGAAIVRAFANAGHRILFTYLTGLPRAHNLHAQYPSATPVHLDQADVHSVSAFAATVSRWAAPHGVDVLVNNAALGSATVQRYVDDKSIDSSQFSNCTPPTPPTPPSPLTNDAISHPASDDASSPSPDDRDDDKVDCDMQIEPKKQSHHPSCNAHSSSESVSELMRRAHKDEALLKVNALGPLWVTQALTDQLHTAAYATPTSRALVIFIGSVGGGSSAVFPEYCAADLMSKAAMTYLSKHLAAKYAREPVDVMCVSPGATETEMFRESTLNKVSDAVSFINSMPKRRLIQPDDIADTVFWLSTSRASSIFHGAVLDASMGLAVRPGLQTETENAR